MTGLRGEVGPKGENGRDGIDGRDGSKGDKGHQGELCVLECWLNSKIRWKLLEHFYAEWNIWYEFICLKGLPGAPGPVGFGQRGPPGQDGLNGVSIKTYCCGEN